MSNCQLEKITCPKCGHEQEVMIYRSINASLDVEARDKLLGNQLFSFSCKECGEMTPLLFDCLYHDMEHGLMVWLKPELSKEELEEMNEGICQMETLDPSMKERYRYRIVRTVNELKEKLTIERENLDDRIIELVKTVYLAHVAEKIGERTVAEVMFDIIDDGYFFTIFYEDEGADPGVIMMDMDVYRRVKEQYEEILNANQTQGFQDISFEWARGVLFGA